MWTDHDREIIEDILDRCYIGDWFVLHLLSKNTNIHIYKRIVKNLAIVMRERKSSHFSSERADRGQHSGGGSRNGGENRNYSLERLEVANGV